MEIFAEYGIAEDKRGRSGSRADNTGQDHRSNLRSPKGKVQDIEAIVGKSR